MANEADAELLARNMIDMHGAAARTIAPDSCSRTPRDHPAAPERQGSPTRGSGKLASFLSAPNYQPKDNGNVYFPNQQSHASSQEML